MGWMGGRARPRINHPERIIQVRLVARIRAIYVDLVFWCGLDGVPLDPRTAAIAKQMGSAADIPDLFFPTLWYWIELKAPGETPNKGQLKLHSILRASGYTVDWFDSVEAAWTALENRLRAPR